MIQQDNWIEIGKIVGAYGIKGELKVYPSSDFPERFNQPGTRWILSEPNPEPKPIKLISGWFLPGKKLYIITLEGISDRTSAELLSGSTLLVTDRDRPSLKEDEYYFRDLVGLKVINQITQTEIGEVVEIFITGNTLLQVKSNQLPDKFYFIPFVKAIVPIVDLDRKLIEITPPEGLLDL